MENVPVDDLPEDLARMVKNFADYLRFSEKVLEKKKAPAEVRLPDFLEIDLGVKIPLTRADIYEDV